MTLEALLRYADDHAPALQTARAQQQLSDAALREANIWLPANPQVSVGAGARSQAGARGLELEVSAQQQLEVAGEPELRRAAAQAHQRVSAASRSEARWAAHVEAHRLFIALLLAREQTAQAARFMAFSQSLRAIAARQVEAGESSPITLLVADADLAQTQGAVIEARQLTQDLQLQLAASIGWPDATTLHVRGALPAVRRAPSTQALLRLMAAHHPTLKARALAIEAARSQLALEQREAWPEPTVGLSYGREAQPDPGAASHVWLLSLSLPLPLWRTNQAGQAQAEAQLQLAQRQRDAMTLRLRSELRRAALAMNAAADRVALYESEIVPQLEQNLALLQRAYTLGEVNIHQVSQTRERLLSATAQHINARILYHERAATLEDLIGTELWPHLEDAP